MSRATPKKLLFLALFIIAIFVIYKIFFSTDGAGEGGMPGGGAPVSVAEVVSREAQQWQEFSGKLVAVDSAEIRPQVSGIIEKVHFKGGEHVKKGQLLFTIDQRPYQAAKEAAQARYTLASTELARSKTLLREKALPQREYDQRKNAAEVAKAEYTRAKLDYDYTLVKAPVSGRVSRPEITQGNLVSAGSPAPLLTTVVSDHPIYADFEIDERSYLQYLQALKHSNKSYESVPVSIGLTGEAEMERVGRVQSFDNQLNPSTGTLRVRAVFENKDGALIPGLFARVRLGSAGDENALLITDRAVGTDQNKKFVLVVGDDNKAMYREVQLGGMVGNLRVVTEGLTVGEKIIVDGLQRAQPGAPVTPEIVPMDGKETEGDKEAVDDQGAEAQTASPDLPPAEKKTKK